MVRSKNLRSPLDTEKVSKQPRSNGMVLVVAALDMSWRLAITVLVPIIGGFELDKYLGITPALTIVGFLVAMAGVFLILKRTVASAGGRIKPKEHH